MAPPPYDPFVRGEFPVGVRTIQAHDAARDRVFSIEIWYPASEAHAAEELRDTAARPGAYPLVVFSHHSGGNRRCATFHCTHLASHGYVVAACDHSETFVPELARRSGETPEERAARSEGWISSRVPDVRFVLDSVFIGEPERSRPVGLIGHSFGGWTVLATPEVEPRIQAVVALAPAGDSNPRPGVLKSPLRFRWGRDVPTLYLVAENDAPLPLDGMYELFQKTPATKRMVILRRADHLHFIDRFEEIHETFRTMPETGELPWLKEILPIGELCTAEQSHLFVRGLALAHMDAVLKGREDAARFLAGDIAGELARRGVEAIVYKPAV